MHDLSMVSLAFIPVPLTAHPPPSAGKPEWHLILVAPMDHGIGRFPLSDTLKNH